MGTLIIGRKGSNQGIIIKCDLLETDDFIGWKRDGAKNPFHFGLTRTFIAHRFDTMMWIDGPNKIIKNLLVGRTQ